MRRLAAALAVDPMSIYHHVPNKQALLQGVYQRVLEELPLPAPPGRSGSRAARTRPALYALARSHPRVLPGLFASRYATPRERDIYAAIDASCSAPGSHPTSACGCPVRSTRMRRGSPVSPQAAPADGRCTRPVKRAMVARTAATVPTTATVPTATQAGARRAARRAGAGRRPRRHPRRAARGPMRMPTSSTASN